MRSARFSRGCLTLSGFLWFLGIFPVVAFFNVLNHHQVLHPFPDLFDMLCLSTVSHMFLALLFPVVVGVSRSLLIVSDVI